ncbi:esterase/lipase [Caulobacter sp. AP07]|uniref:alpha/beta hydrolase fold domain-containing protein n=1 Tax=Caulobacter sp. AP07 TaxID=1144304 RepID=UPI0002720C78|nr:alpha/beta hydrolase fold domain-containing protein [Caulobacter sp. AP07]EJL25228.1 esterase/lipase [Caulobacter sp. AP07]
MNQQAPDPRLFIPASVSAEAAAILAVIGGVIASLPPREPPRTLEDFDAAKARGEAFAAQMTAAPLAALAPELEPWTAGDAPVLSVRPRSAREGAAPLIYVHGGGFAGGSAHANLLTAALAAETSGRVVHSVDYTLAPRAQWRQVIGEVVAVCEAVARDTPAFGLFGDSAGGCIAAAATLALRDAGAATPSALVLISPVTDLAGGGDTNRTLAPYDYLDADVLAPALRAYADPADWHEPLVSPIRGDFKPGYPPTLLQVGTREILLSDSVRLHRALRAAGQSSRLEIYEGMPHVFQPTLAQTPEGVAAWAEIADFWLEHLA